MSEKLSAKIEIRIATPADAAEIANVHINSWREAYKGLLPQEFLDDRPLYFKSRYELWKSITLNDPQSTYVVESQDYGLIGFINGGEPRDQGYADYVEIKCLYLLQRFHRQGIGFKLLKTFFSYALEVGYSQGYLWVLKNNPSIHFYEKTGAKLSKDNKKDRIGGTEVEELRYVWSSLL